MAQRVDKNQVGIEWKRRGLDGRLINSKWAAIAKCSQETALRDINDLLGRGVLRKSAAGVPTVYGSPTFG